jgi:hypothetical protein
LQKGKLVIYARAQNRLQPRRTDGTSAPLAAGQPPLLEVCGSLPMSLPRSRVRPPTPPAPDSYSAIKARCVSLLCLEPELQPIRNLEFLVVNLVQESDLRRKRGKVTQKARASHFLLSLPRKPCSLISLTVNANQTFKIGCDQRSLVLRSFSHSWDGAPSPTSFSLPTHHPPLQALL